MHLIAWSYSRLTDFEQCPKMFYGKHISKEFYVDASSPALIRGRSIHKLLEKIMKMGSKEMTGDMAYLAPFIDKLRKGEVVYIEKKIAFNRNGKVIDWFNKKVWLRVIFDVAVINGTTAFIIDWKTGKVRDKNRDQLALFAVATFMAYLNIEDVITAYIWVDHPKAKASVNVFQRSDAARLMEMFAERSELIQLANESGQWKAKPGNLCCFCPARSDQCEHR